MSKDMKLTCCVEPRRHSRLVDRIQCVYVRDHGQASSGSWEQHGRNFIRYGPLPVHPVVICEGREQPVFFIRVPIAEAKAAAARVENVLYQTLFANAR